MFLIHTTAGTDMPDDSKETFWSALLFLFASAILSLTLPVLWPNLSKPRAIECSGAAVLLLLIAACLAYRTHRHNATHIGRGGAGGNAISIGDDNEVEGGRGGRANEGIGGTGGNAIARGNRSKVRGGRGGDGGR